MHSESTVPSSLIASLDRLARVRPTAPLFRFVDGNGHVVDEASAASTWRAGEAIAARLTARSGLRRGDRALMVYTPSLAFVRALVGCLRAGIVPVPVAPADPSNLAYDLQRLRAMAESAGARVVLTNREYARYRLLSRVEHRVRGLLGGERPEWPDLPWVTTDDGGSARDVVPPYVEPAPGELAVLQYTSGSTSAPKGVMITHGNLRHQLAANARTLGLSVDSIAVVWVPHFHDFGLISGIMSALAGNGQLVMMSPLTFVRRPDLWLDVMSRTRATHTAAPNFAYELAVRKTTAAQRARWDLRSLEVAMSAAEPVRHETVRAFVEAFEPSGFRASSFCPAYGLAEHTVGVSVGGRAIARVERASLERAGAAVRLAEGPSGRALVGCGAPFDDVRLRIVDPTTGTACGDLTVGEIWVDSPSKAAGYYGLDDETRATFRARIAGDDTEYLRTGDLGFVHRGEIFVTGRLKDLIIVRGRNVYPEDVEDTVRTAHPLVRPGGIAAFSFDDGSSSERVAVVVEARERSVSARDGEAVVSAVRERVLADHRIACRSIVVVAPGAVPKTTSGKVRRSACRDALLRGELDGKGEVLFRSRELDDAPPEAEREDPSEALPAARPRPIDLGLDALEPEYAALVGELCAMFAARAGEKRARLFHARATTLSGELEIAPGAPRSALFAPGRRYAVLVRHANGAQDDDAAIDNRGATLRVLDPERPDRLDAPLLDLLLTTGECFPAGTAASFRDWLARGPSHRSKVAESRPEVSRAAWTMLRRGASFARYRYGSKTALRLTTAGGETALVRFRLSPADGGEEGLVEPAGLLPPDTFAREPGDARATTFMHDDLRARISTGGVRYVLEAQVRADDGSEALDATLPWPEAEHPWREIGRLRLDAIVDPSRIEPLDFSPLHLPLELELPIARRATEPASLGHLRAVVYAAAAHARRGAAMPDAVRALVARARPARIEAGAAASGDRAPAGPRIVCVIGAGPSGLAAARELERLGHRVTVLERAPEVAGKCASIEIDGRWFDWGGHICTSAYRETAQLLDEVGLAREPATPSYLFDVDTRERRIDAGRPFAADAMRAYAADRAARFAAVRGASLRPLARALAAPTTELRGASAGWASALVERFGVGYAAAGYGLLPDAGLPLLYLVRYAEMTGLLAPELAADLPPLWTVAGGFGSLWRRIAGSLRDVRCGQDVRGIEREGGRVRVRVGDERLEFDAVVVATGPAEALAMLDATPSEQSVLGRARTLDYHTTIVRARGLPPVGFYLLDGRCRADAQRGRPVAFHVRYPGSDVALFYSYGDGGTDPETIDRHVLEDVARMGATGAQLVDRRAWSYFPHVGARDVAGGYFDALEALQGNQSTYFVGSLFAFELVECNVAYARALARRFFATEAAERAPEIRSPRASALSETAGLDHVIRHLRDAVARELRSPELPRADASLRELGLDSLALFGLVQKISSDAGVSLDPAAVLERGTIAGLAELVLERRAESARRSVALAGSSRAHGPSTITEHHEQTKDVVCGEAHGLSITLDVFTPRGASNGLGVVDVASAMWMSGRDVIDDHAAMQTYDAFCSRGFTVFAVRPGSRTLMSSAVMADNLRAAIRWVKREADGYGVDADRLTLLGGSAGGHLGMLAVLDPEGANRASVDGLDASVHAVVLFCPVFDPREVPLRTDRMKRIAAEMTYGGPRAPETVDVPAVRASMAALHPRLARAPRLALVLHGSRDVLVPLSSSAQLVEALRRAGTDAELIERDSDRHPWPEIAADMHLAADWLRARLVAGLPSETRAWLAVLRRAETPAFRLVVLPAAGDSPEAYARWAELLPRDVELLAVRMPGRPPREAAAPPESFEVLVDALARALEPLSDVPYVLFGHSLGALTAFELARALRRSGARLPAHLFLSSFVAPHRAGSAEEAFGSVSRLMGEGAPPHFLADLAIARTWRYLPAEPLDIDLSVLAATHDPLVFRDGVEAWKEHTRGAFALAWHEGDHGYLADAAPSVVARIVAVMRGGREPRPSASIAGDALERFRDRWRARPASRTGAWHTLDACWIARVPDPRDASRPAFPDAIERLLAAQRADGAPTPSSPEPYSDLVVALAFAATFARWRHLDERFARAMRAAALYAVRLVPLLEPRVSPHGDRFELAGFAGRALVPAREAEAVLAHAGDALDEGARAALERLAGDAGARTAAAEPWSRPPEECFARDSIELHFGEHFPASAIASSAARAHVERARGLPGVTAALTSRYAESTGDPRAHAALRRLLERPDDGLRPGARLQETQFALHYLLGALVDVAGSFEPEWAWARSMLGPGGAPVEEGTREPDCDGTAVGLAVCHQLGITAPTSTAVLETFWSEARQSYASANGQHHYAVSTALHVLDATIAAPDLPRDAQIATLRRVVGLLERGRWAERYHCSPLYVWEKIARVLFRAETLFPDVSTRAHHDALGLVLSRQLASGGIGAAFGDQPTIEETALGMLAMSAALRGSLPDRERARVHAALDRAHAFVASAVAGREHLDDEPGLWVAKVLYHPPRVVEAIVVSALHAASMHA